MRVLTPAAAMEAARLYELRNSKGRPVHTLASIADILGVGETTIFRVVKRRGAFTALPALKTEEEAAQSAAAFEAAHPELFSGEVKPVALPTLSTEAEATLAKERGYID